MAVSINSDTVEGLVESGQYAAAASLAREQGDLERAAELFEKVWDFSAAAQCAEAAGDLERALRNAISAGAQLDVDRLTSVIAGRGPDATRSAVALLTRNRWFAVAAPLAESIEDHDHAIELYRRAHLDLEAARVLIDIGRDSEAGRLLEHFIEGADVGSDLSKAHLALGEILARRLQHKEAVRHLQRAVDDPESRSQAQRSLIIELVALDLRDAARQVLLDARRDDPDLPIDLEAFVRTNRGTAGPAERNLVGGRYLLGDLLGAGGSGRVYRGTDEVTRKDVAIKLFDIAHARGRQGYERFVRETSIAGDLRHPNIVSAFDFSADHGYLVMELMTGGSLTDKLKPRLTEPAVRRMALEILAGLEAAHRHGIIHRDIKPANIFFDARGIAKLGDFGVAHLLDLGHTQTGGLIGTIAYMSPEQITGARLTVAADFYSLGITLFESLTGYLPFRGPDFIAEHLGAEPPKPTDLDPDLSSGWDDLIDRLLQKSPSERFASIADVRNVLQTLDLSKEEAQPLLLPRATSAHRIARTTAAPPIIDAAPTEDKEAAPRYQFETPLGTTSISTLSRAVDSILGRTVIIERFDPDALDAVTVERLYHLSQGGGPFLQRALSFDTESGVLVLEAPTGAAVANAPPAYRLGRRGLVRLLRRLARALAPLHRHHHAHGALSPQTVLIDELGFPTIMASGLGPATGNESCADDIREIVATANILARESTEDLVSELAASPWPPADAFELLAVAAVLEVTILDQQLAS